MAIHKIRQTTITPPTIVCLSWEVSYSLLLLNMVRSLAHSFSLTYTHTKTNRCCCHLMTTQSILHHQEKHTRYSLTFHINLLDGTCTFPPITWARDLIFKIKAHSLGLLDWCTTGSLHGHHGTCGHWADDHYSLLFFSHGKKWSLLLAVYFICALS